MRRGDLVTVSLPGAYGKPRPALVIQSDHLDLHPSVVVLPVTSELRDTPLFRIDLKPSDETGLRKSSQVMVDKPHTMARDKISAAFGRVDDATLVEINRALAVVVGLA